MRNGSSLTLLATLVICIYHPGCQTTIVDPIRIADDSGSAILQTEPENTLVVGFFEQRDLSIQLVNVDTGAPIRAQPIAVDFIGPAHNGTLIPGEFLTDDNGQGQVVFTSPNQTGAFQIRFSTPTAQDDFFIDVTVDEHHLNVSLSAVYSGSRKINQVTARLYKDISCDALRAPDNAVPFDDLAPLDVQVLRLDPLAMAANFDFRNGIEGTSQYTIEAIGQLNHAVDEQPGAVVNLTRQCGDGLVPNAVHQPLALKDEALGVMGAFQFEAVVHSGTTLTQYIDDLFMPIREFDADKAAAILSAIEERLAKIDQLAAENFAKIVAADGLNAILNADFNSRNVHFVEEFSPIGVDIKNQLNPFKAGGELKFGTANPTTPTRLRYEYKVEHLTFRDNQVLKLEDDFRPDEAELSHSATTQLKVGNFIAEIDLGDVLMFLFNDLALGSSESDDDELWQLFDEIVDCGAVAEKLLGHVAEITDKAELQNGCTDALKGLQQALFTAAEAISNECGDKLKLTGKCHLVDPLTDIWSTAISSVDGELTMFWTSNQIGWEGPCETDPMAVKFSANRTDDI